GPFGPHSRPRLERPIRPLCPVRSASRPVCSFDPLLANCSMCSEIVPRFFAFLYPCVRLRLLFSTRALSEPTTPYSSETISSLFSFGFRLPNLLQQRSPFVARERRHGGNFDVAQRRVQNRCFHRRPIVRKL